MSMTMGDPVARFWAKVDKDGPVSVDLGTRCWIWTGPLYWNGYGVFSRGGRSGGNVRAHRFSWEVSRGSSPGGMLVLHHCDTRRCVNPEHLFLGTHKDNINDCTAKRRHVFGSKHVLAKLTEESALEVIRRRKRGEPRAALAREFQVCVTTIDNVLARRKWRHVLVK